MSEAYIYYEEVTREILDTIKIGDMVRINDWEWPMCVKAVSENYFVMTHKEGDDTYYSVCSKLPWPGIRHNQMTGGMFHCGCDDWIFGSPLAIRFDKLYQFENEEANRLYLADFETEKCHISERNGVPIVDLYVLPA